MTDLRSLPKEWDRDELALQLAEAFAEEIAYTGPNGIAAILEHADHNTLHRLNEEATRARMERHGLRYHRKKRRAA